MERHQSNGRSASCGRMGGFTTGMSATNNNDVEFRLFHVKHRYFPRQNALKI